MGRCLTLSLCVLLGAAAAQSAEEPRKLALLVGINQYQGARFSDLRFAERDMEALDEDLQQLGFETQLLRGARATRAEIEKALRRLVAQAAPEDTLLLALAGHGLQIEAPTTGGAMNEEAYFCPVDADLGQPRTLLGLKYLIDDVLARDGGCNLLLVDACRAQAHADGLRGIQGQRLELPENTAVLFACAAGQTTVESPRLGGGHGVFTYSVLEALRTCTDASGEATWSGMVAAMESVMTSSSELRKILDRAPQQDPIHAGHVKRAVLGRSQAAPLHWARSQHPHVPSIAMYSNSLGMKFVRIPRGEFTQGAIEPESELLAAFPDLESENLVDEQPAHRVRISRPFFMGAHEVTLGQFDAFCTEADYIPESFRDGKGAWGYTNDRENPRRESTDHSHWTPGFIVWYDHPVINVSWNDAQAFCAWLSKKEKLVYRLPTEAEWEYACRAGTTTHYSSGMGAESLAGFANIADAAMQEKFSRIVRMQASDGYAFTAPVGSFRPNAFGLYDMHGNATEWCRDWHDPAYYRSFAGKIAVDPQGPQTGAARVLRGGGWDSPPSYARSSFRFHYRPDYRYYTHGFRIVLGSQ